MNNWYGRDRYNNDRNMNRSSNPDDVWTRRPSERYDRENYYRNENPDHFPADDEQSSFHWAGKFEDRNDPTYGDHRYDNFSEQLPNYGTRNRDLMRGNDYRDPSWNQRHPLGTQSGYRSEHYDRGFNRSKFGTNRATQPSGDMSRHLINGDPNYEWRDMYTAMWPDNQLENYSGRGPKNWKRSDESIHDQVCQALERHPRIDAREIEVEVKDGIVTLRGNIHDRPAKRLAEDIIEYLPGVQDVHNQLMVDKTFFERAKEFFTGEATESKPGKTEKNPRH